MRLSNDIFLFGFHEKRSAKQKIKVPNNLSNGEKRLAEVETTSGENVELYKKCAAF